MAPNFGIETYVNARTGRHCKVPKVPPTPSRARTEYCNSLGFRGTQLFNILPKYLRDLHVDANVFKKHLDAWLSKIPDEPTSRQETRMRAAASNSLIHQKPTTETGLQKR